METATKAELLIELNSTLTIGEIRGFSAGDFNKTLTSRGTTVRDAINGSVRHKNYLNYLEIAWGSHHGIVFSPDILWHIVLNEVSTHIKGNSELYRELFTANPSGKTEIRIPTNDTELIDLSVIVDKLTELIPSDVSPFLLKFSTSNAESQLAFNAAFADAMTPYYNYSMFCCGISKVKVLGEVEDWVSIKESLSKLVSILNKKGMKAYFNKVESLVDRIIGGYTKESKDSIN